MSKALTIREATAEDLQAVVALAPEFFAMSPYTAITTLDPASASASLTALQANPLGVVLVARHEKAVVGFIFGSLTPLYFNTAYTVAVEAGWYVIEAYRNDRAGLSLLWAFEDWAFQNGAKAVVMSALATNPKVLQTYRKAGYTPVETTALKVL